MKTKNAIETQVKGVKCDAFGCTYMDKSVDNFDKLETFHNKPCPLCGASLLTTKDLMTVKAMRALTEAANAIMGPQDASEPQVRVRIHGNGSGIPAFEFISKENENNSSYAPELDWCWTCGKNKNCTCDK